MMEPSSSLILTGLPIVGFLLALVLLSHLLTTQRSPASTAAWLLAIVLIPYVGVPLYMLFGGRKLKRMVNRKRQLVLDTAAGTAPSIGYDFGVRGIPASTLGNHATMLGTGEAAYHAILQALDGARESVCVTTFILGNDTTGREILQRLTQKAAAGVKVYLLLDALGSFWAHRRPLQALERAGGAYAFFMPMFPLPFRGRANLRNHRKMIVVDGHTAFVGGMNLAQEYLGPDLQAQRWRDLVIQVQGPAVAQLHSIFAADWEFADPRRPLAPIAPHTAVRWSAGDSLPIQVVPSGPDVEGDPIHEQIVTTLYAAKERVWVITPYFAPDEVLLHAMGMALRRGVEVRILVPRRSNHRLADWVRGAYLRYLQASGCAVHGYPGMLHAKLILVDEDLAIVGSANMDMRSLFLNYEIALVMHSSALVQDLSRWVNALLQQSQPYHLGDSRIRRLFEGMARLLAPLL
jgi:cardiolipin synthase